MTPSVGRVVHYVEGRAAGGTGECRAAVITEVTPVHTGGIGLFVMRPATAENFRGVPYDENKNPGTWHWPERVE